MGFVSAKEAAEQWGLTKRRVLTLCREGRIPGAQLVDTMWVIPDDATKPEDGRSLRYRSEEGDGGEIRPLKQSVQAAGHTPQYRMHKYFARRPYNVFQHLLKHYTRKGDVVLDPFCGGGVTVFEAAALGRKPVGVDLNPLAAFITRMQMFNGEVEELRDFFRRFLLAETKKYRDWYRVEWEDDHGVASWIEWVYTVRCPQCGAVIELLEENKVSNGVYRCPNVQCACHASGVKRVQCAPVSSHPLRARYQSDKTGQWMVRPIGLENMPALGELNFDALVDALPCKPEFAIPVDWDRRYEDKLEEKGIHRYPDFFTQRNFALNCLIFQDILALKGTTGSQLNEYLYFLFSSSLRYTNKMTRVTDRWEGGKPTAMDKHAFWLPNQYVETNILEVLSQRAAAIVKGCEYAAQHLPKELMPASNYEDFKLHNSYMVWQRDSARLPLPDESVDAIITDPPYGSNVQYAELSTIWNAWYALYSGLDRCVYKEQEAVMNRKSHYPGAKGVEEYEELLYRVYAEGNRVLKPGGYLVFTFQNKNIKVWVAMLKAVARAGFYLPEDGVLFQDYIESYKNTAHLRFSGNVQGDFIYSFRKGTPGTVVNGAKGFSAIIQESVDATLARLYKRRKSYSTAELYQKVLSGMTRDLMQYIQWCMSTGTPMEDISQFSNDYLENRFKQTLVWEEGCWRKG
ncbi:MAG: DNA methyltransferase [Eubacteriales bacterium]|jgi:putative DNA methylase